MTNIILTTFALLILFQLKHFLADYIFQNEYHLGKFKETGWVATLTSHCLYHVVGTVLITALALMQFDVYTIIAMCLILGTFDFVVHFIMDRVKASPKMLGVYKPNQKQFWWSLGLDQCVHHITHDIIVVVILFVMFYTK